MMRYLQGNKCSPGFTIFIVSMLFIVQCPLQSEELPHDQHTILLFHFNDDLSSTTGETPVSATGIVLEPGLFGNGVRVHRGESAYSGDSLWYPVPEGFNPAEGTVEFWLQPRWIGQDFYSIQLFNLGDIRIQINYPSNFRFFMQIDDNETGCYRINDWQSDEWHHIAVTWKIPGRQILYIDGVEITNDRADELDLLTTIPDYFTIGYRLPLQNAEALIDELRLSNIQRSPFEIAQSVNASGMQVTALQLEPDSVHLLPDWSFMVRVAAETDIGADYLPNALIDWQVEDSSIATIDENGILTASASGNTIFTGTYGEITVQGYLNVDEIWRQPDESAIDPYLLTPAENYIWEMPVAIINFYPMTDDNMLEHWMEHISVDSIKERNNVYYKRVKFMLEEGSRYHSYKDSSALPSLGYRIVKIINIYEHMPMSKKFDSWQPNCRYPDFHKIFERIDAEYLVNELGVKEFWIWSDLYNINGHCYTLPESNMSSPVTGNISNSFRLRNILPIYNHYYSVYHFLHHRLATAHNHGHQIESMLIHANELQDGNNHLFLHKFCGMDETETWITGRCGWTHMTPNLASHYIYDDTTTLLSDCMNWHPEGGPQTPVNVSTWRDIDYPWPPGTEYGNEPPYCLDFGRAENHFYIFWRNNIPGYNNNIKFDDSTKIMNNWWEFVGDWENAIQTNKGLYTLVQTGVKTQVNTKTFALLPAYPNPCNATTTIEYQLAVNSRTKIDIFNIIGQRVTTLVDTYQTAGHYRLSWNGFDNNRRSLPSGVYLIRLEARHTDNLFSKIQRVVLLR
ncbi:T9SS type A sorting domain-containing protein [candidate division KSB1 bacterium]|nr:T9SS type A sorting domain-containing protein [candidate division KSB1 bacterium]